MMNWSKSLVLPVMALLGAASFATGCASRPLPPPPPIAEELPSPIVVREPAPTVIEERETIVREPAPTVLETESDVYSKESTETTKKITSTKPRPIVKRQVHRRPSTSTYESDEIFEEERRLGF